MNPDYVNDRSFRLMFLGCERYDPKESAKRMIAHFHAKKDLFGTRTDVLARDILWSDLSDDDRETIEAGHVQVLPRRDAAGRIVLFIVPQKRKYRTVRNMVRKKTEENLHHDERG